MNHLKKNINSKLCSIDFFPQFGNKIYTKFNMTLYDVFIISEMGIYKFQSNCAKRKKNNNNYAASQVNVLMAMVDGASLSGGSFCPFSRRRLGFVTRTLENSTNSPCSKSNNSITRPLFFHHGKS